ncbi:hypothetical protein BGZ75_010419 [Mortierella antarctica]|nr:hypothetical protein BGZ75_010419 [Mortierella antarctica]
MEVLSRSSVSNRQKLPQEELSIGRHSLDTSSSVPSTPPPSLPARDKYFSPGEDIVLRFAKDLTEEITGGLPTFGSDSEKDSRMPPFVTKARSQSKPVLLDTYFTFHSPSNDDVIYTSDTVAGSNELRDIPAGLPNNTILFGFESGFYTAPDEDDMLDHPHTTAQEPLASIPGVSLKRSYTYECVMRLNNLHECIADTRESRNEIKRNIEAALVKENAPMIMEHAARRKALAESRERGQTQEMYLEENLINLAKNKESLFHVLREFSTKRTELIATLFTIFPITGSDKDSKPLKICNVPLPNSDYTVGPKEFPLFGKGQERLRFEYGVFLLNKDIEQLMNAYGRQFMDLRRTLPNLRDLMETLITKKQRQDRIEPERRNEHFTMSRDQHEFERGLNTGVEGTGLGESGSAGSGSQPGHERQTSSTRLNPGDHSLLAREYDPVDGEYVLILDNTPVRSPRSPRDATGSDVSPPDRTSPRNIPTSPRGVQLAHERMRSGLQHDYSSSLSLSSTATDDNEDGQCADHPAFRDWASVAPEPVRDAPCETNLDTTAQSVVTPQVESEAPKSLSSPFDSKISKYSLDNDLGPSHISNSNRVNSRPSRDSLTEGSVSERSSPELHGHIGKTSSSSTFSSSSQILPTHLSKLGLNVVSGALDQLHDTDGAIGKEVVDVVEDGQDLTILTHSSLKSMPSTSSTARKEHTEGHAEERIRQGLPRVNSLAESRLQQEQQCEQENLETRERQVSFEEGRRPTGLPPTDSLEGAFSDPGQAQKQRGTRLSNRVIMTGNEAGRTKSEEMVYSQLQPSTPTAPSGVLEASG